MISEPQQASPLPPSLYLFQCLAFIIDFYRCCVFGNLQDYFFVEFNILMVESFGFNLGFILEPNVETTFVGTEVGTAIRKHI